MNTRPGPISARLTVTWAVLLLLLSGGSAIAGDWSGDVGGQARVFAHPPLSASQERHDFSLHVEPDYYHDWDNGRQRFELSLFARLDSADTERTHADIRELYWRRSFAAAELSLGLRKVFWGVTESVHLVDIINQSDLLENLDTEDKLGQPMLALSLISNWGTVDFMLMPYFRERQFQGSGGRLRAPLPVLSDHPTYESDQAQKHLDIAVRWSQFIGDWDIGLAHFSGTAREPRMIAAISPNGELALRPHYELIDQTSADVQATLGAWLWKLEAIYRRDNLDHFISTAAGFEYTFYGLAGGATDLGIVAEYIYDQRGNNATSGFENDVALGARLALNDTQSSELLALLGHDLDDRSRFISVEANRRLGQAWRLSLEARWFTRIAPANTLFFVREDDYVELALSRFF